MTKVVRNAAFEAYEGADGVDLGTRIKDVRTETLIPGGRAHTTLFSRGGGRGRPHPRLSFEWPAAKDPSPPGDLFTPSSVPTDDAALANAIDQARKEHEGALSAGDLADADAPAGSELWWRNSIRVQRTAAFFATVRAKVDAWRQQGTLTAGQRACELVVKRKESEAYAGDIAFDDANTGTYHSYGHDAPFVHYLEQILETLPVEGSEAMAVLNSSARLSIRRQRTQAREHLDWLMREKYAYNVPRERDIEQTVGGFLIDRRTRNIASEADESDPIAPTYVLLRIDPTAEHEHAGAWVYRNAKGKLFLQDHTAVEIPAEVLLSAPIDTDALTFKRAPKDPALRKDMRFDWDGNGYVDADPISWVSWAGHCDVKAVLEQLGVSLLDKPSVEEFRSDTGETKSYGRDLMLEMVASAIELGSTYRHIDGTGYRVRGNHQFGGSRNDSRPDRLQFRGPGRGKSFRWPRRGRHEAFVVKSIEWPDGDKADMGTVFFRHLPDREAVSFEDNPRFLKTVEGDYNLIDISGATIEARVAVDTVNATTGYLTQTKKTVTVKLSADARPEDGRYFLGTEVASATNRLIYEVYYEPANNRIVAELKRWEKQGDEYVAVDVPERHVSLPMIGPLTVTLSREMKRDNPAQFSALLDVALREGKNICADTDKQSEVWNGVVTNLTVNKLGENTEARTEHWTVDVKARFGEAKLDYLVRRNSAGTPEAYCPARGDTHAEDWPDFLWHDVPDVGTKALIDGRWLVNDSMWDRGIVDVAPDASVSAGFYVRDDHVKNVYELLFSGLAGYAFTVLHNNKRYGFREEAAWKKAVDELEKRRRGLTFETE